MLRSFVEGELPEAYASKMNIMNCYNSRCLRFLGVVYNDLLEQVKLGKTDQEVIDWCFETGKAPHEAAIFVWNQFMEKKGWRDEETEQLEPYKAESGLTGRDDIVIFFDCYEADEGRIP